MKNSKKDAIGWIVALWVVVIIIIIVSHSI